MKMQVDEAGLGLIKAFEGLRLNAYKDIAGIWTIGYGCTYYVGGKHVQAGDKLANESAAEAMLKNVLAVYEGAVNSKVKVTITQNQYNAILSFTYNTGIGALESSSMLILLNQGNYQGAADHLMMWDKITDPETGKKIVSETLFERRTKERQLFLTK